MLGIDQNSITKLHLGGKGVYTMKHIQQIICLVLASTVCVIHRHHFNVNLRNDGY